MWQRALEHVIPTSVYPPAVRRMIDTTNAVGTLHRSLRKVIKTRGSFPTNEADIKLLFLAIKHSGVRWKQARGWTEALAQFTVLFGDRLIGAAC